MSYATAIIDGSPAAVLITSRGAAAVVDLVPGLVGDLFAVIDSGRAAEIESAADLAPDATFRPVADFELTVPYRHPRKIWGIGLNYVEHAGDLAENVPDEPASFIKGDHTIIAPGEVIPLPVQSDRVTAEAELGIVIGKYCRNVTEADALDYVFGVCTVLDQTAEDILQRNPRFLTRSKNFPGFFSFGPTIVTLDEVSVAVGPLADVRVSTMINGAEHRTNTVSNMTHSPEMLIAFHSAVMPLFPGDIISTGTPGAVVIEDGDVAGCIIPGVGELSNPVERAR